MVNITPDSSLGLAVGTVVGLDFPGRGKKFYQVTKRDKILLRDLHSSLASGSVEAFTEITNLDPPLGQLYQIYQIKMDGNTELQLKQPAATNRWGTQRSPTGGFLLDKYNGELISVWIAEDFPPNTQLTNNTDVAVATTLWWIGWRYEVVQVSQPATFVEASVTPPTE